MHFGRNLWATGSILALSCGLGCRGADDGDLAGPPDGSQCPDEAAAWCDETCVDTASSLLHCGGCGVVCDQRPETAERRCLAGACVVEACEGGFADCDESFENGCEAELATAKEHCGGCGIACATQCSGGACDDPIEVSAGPSFTCALRAAGSVWCWGDNTWGNLGLGISGSTAVPARVSLPGPAIAVSTGKLQDRMHACALLEGGAVLCWGANGNGQLGTGNALASSSPLPVDVPESTRIAVGGVHTCVVSKAHQLRCWGANGSGQLGLGMAVGDQYLPALVLNNVDDVAAGGEHTCARLLNGTVACWGGNGSGQVGNGFQTTAYAPAILPGLGGTSALGLGSSHSCALLGDGTMKCWGEGAQGQLGTSMGADLLTPQPVPLAGVELAGVGVASSWAVIDGALWAWGANQQAQLGTGDAEPAPAPRRTLLDAVTRAALGGRHGCALRAGGELVCWGDNDAGQLGNGGTEPSPLPVPVVFPSESP